MFYPSLLLITQAPHRDILSTYIPFTSITSNPDVHIIEEETSIGIDAIKHLIPILSRKPFREEYKVIVLLHAQTMTPEAQNALLKSIEEPPEHTQVILVATSIQPILPTILSRCTLIQDKTGNESFDNTLMSLEETLNLSYEDAINAAQVYGKDKPTTITWCQSLLSQAYTGLHQRPTKTYVEYIQEISEALSSLEKNVNTRLTLEHLLFHIRLAK